MANGLTKRQAALVKNMLDPNVKTKKQAGELAGYASPQTTSESLSNPNVRSALTKLAKRRLDKARGPKAIADRLLHGIESDDLETLPIRDRIQAASILTDLDIKARSSGLYADDALELTGDEKVGIAAREYQMILFHALPTSLTPTTAVTSALGLQLQSRTTPF